MWTQETHKQIFGIAKPARWTHSVKGSPRDADRDSANANRCAGEARVRTSVELLSFARTFIRVKNLLAETRRVTVAAAPDLSQQDPSEAHRSAAVSGSREWPIGALMRKRVSV